MGAGADEAKKAIDANVEQNLDLVHIIARQLTKELGQAIPLEDLQSAGREGLVTAAMRFDETRGVPFRRYANHRVRGSMIDAMRREAALPRRTYEKLRALSAALDLNEHASEELTAPKAPGETQAMLDAKLAEHLATMATAIASGLVCETAMEDEELVAVAGGMDPEELASRKQLRALMKSALDELPEQEQTLVRRHYFGGERFDLVAKELGLSKSWASRLHTRAVGRLTKILGAR